MRHFKVNSSVILVTKLSRFCRSVRGSSTAASGACRFRFSLTELLSIQKRPLQEPDNSPKAYGLHLKPFF